MLVACSDVVASPRLFSLTLQIAEKAHALLWASSGDSHLESVFAFRITMSHRPENQGFNPLDRLQIETKSAHNPFVAQKRWWHAPIALPWDGCPGERSQAPRDVGWGALHSAKCYLGLGVTCVVKHPPNPYLLLLLRAKLASIIAKVFILGT